MTIDKGTDAAAGARADDVAASSEASRASGGSSGGSGSPIEFRLDPGSGVPTYRQLVQQVEHALRLGYLKPGDQLPTVKGTVTALAINPNTVLKAYRELEQRGLAAGRPGQGTFVEGTLGQVPLAELTGLRRTLLGWLNTADAAGLDDDGIVALFTSALSDFRARPGAAAGSSDRGGRSGRSGSGADPAGRARASGGTAGVA
jgi:GntR family transcriptional regulator